MLPWSLSQHGLYKKCPSAYNFRVVQRIPDPSGPAAARGTEIHGQLEAYLQTGEWHGNIRSFTRQKAEGMRGSSFQPELKLALDKDWKVVDWKSPDAWVRCVIDAFLCADDRIKMGEWKTGKQYEDHATQRRLYLCLTMSAFPQAISAEIETIYADLDYAVPDVLLREQVPEEQRRWQDIVTPMLNDTFFSPRPGQHCRWCNYSRLKGGPCLVA